MSKVNNQTMTKEKERYRTRISLDDDFGTEFLFLEKSKTIIISDDSGESCCLSMNDVTLIMEVMQELGWLDGYIENKR